MRRGARLVEEKVFAVSSRGGAQRSLAIRYASQQRCSDDCTHRTQAQGAFKYGGYEYFKKFYSDLAGEQNTYKYKTWLYLGASASAEAIADVALCPFEAVKVRMQTTIPPFASGTFSGISTITAKEGIGG